MDKTASEGQHPDLFQRQKEKAEVHAAAPQQPRNAQSAQMAALKHFLYKKSRAEQKNTHWILCWITPGPPPALHGPSRARAGSGTQIVRFWGRTLHPALCLRL